MAVTIIANGHLGTLKKQRVSTNSTSVQLSKILNDANIIPPVTNEPGKVFSFWGTTINGFDIGGYTINQLYSIGAITKDGILNIYANYSYAANNVQITFNANGGKFADGTTTKAISVPLGSIYAELESNIDLPTLSGKAFKAWTDPSNTVINGYSEFSGAIILTAQWETATNVNIAVKDSRGKSVISGAYPKATLWKDLYAKAIANGYTPDDTTKPFSKILPGYGSYTGQAVKKIDFSVANNPMKIGWLRGSIYEAGNADVSLYTNRNLYINATQVYGYVNGSQGTILPVNPSGVNKEMVSDYISVLPNTKYTFQAWGSLISGQQYWAGIGQYDVNKAFLNRAAGIYNAPTVTSDVGNDYEKTTFTTDANTYFVRVSSRTFGNYKIKFEEGDTATAYQKAPEDVNKKIRDFSATTVPVDPSTTFSVIGKSSAALALTHNPLDNYNYLGNENLLLNSNFTKGFNSWINEGNAWSIDDEGITTSGVGGGSRLFQSIDTSNLKVGDKVTVSFYAKASSNNATLITVIMNGAYIGKSLTTEYKKYTATWTIDQTFLDIPRLYLYNNTSGQTVWIKDEIQFEKGDQATEYSPSPRDNKPGLWLNDDWLYNPYTQKWLDSSLDRTDFTYSNAVITFKDYFNIQYVTGDISKIRPSVVATVKSVVAGYGSTTDKHSLYNNSYFPNSDSGVTLKVEEYLGYAYIIFYNPSSGYYQKVYQQAGTKYSEFLKLISKPKFDINGKFMKGFYVSNYWANSKLISGMPINAPIEYAFSGYLSPSTSSFVRVTFDANGGSFYKDTSYETSSITMEVSSLDTYGIVINYLPDISKRTLGILFWVMDLINMEPAYPLTVTNGQTLYPKWTITDKVELYRKPREYYLIDLDSVYNGWDMMDKFSLSDKNNIFVIDPTGTGVSYSEDNTKSNSNGWSKYDRGISSNVIEFEAYYNGYDQYNRLGRWIRGKELVLAMLNETGIPTYWTVDIAEIERTEIKYGEDLLHGKISFNKTSPAFDLEFIGLGTDNTIDNSDDMFRRNAYVYIHSLMVPDDDKGIQIIATDGKTTIEDSVDVNLPAGSYFEYSTLPFRELWKYGSSWNNLPNSLYNNIIDLVGARPIKVGIGKWDISVSSSTKVSISSLAPHKIQDYAGKTIDSLGGLGPFTGIAIKEKEL